ncbi:MAG: HIT family protein [Clostridiales bacterium]|jgi:diadenosine tetraphosphate (Ap4A) HIT family hydrolase|nr:HIT family protein [Clostridiales bacterium]
MDKKDCLYCGNKEKLDSLMIYITDLGVSKLYLFKEQTYYGRCVMAYNEHAVELTELDDDKADLFIKDMRRVGKAINKAVNPAKVNYGMFSDTLPHLHVHIVPKQRDGYSFGGTFDMNVNPPKYLSEEEYKEIIERIKDNL